MGEQLRRSCASGLDRSAKRRECQFGLAASQFAQNPIRAYTFLAGSDCRNAHPELGRFFCAIEVPRMNRALLALEDGRVFWGRSVGASGERAGEVVFNTSMTGYGEILTDP